MADHDRSVSSRTGTLHDATSSMLMNQDLHLPPGPSQKFRSILPKTPPERQGSRGVSRRQLTTTTATATAVATTTTNIPRFLRKTCQVVVCTRSNCTLRTHRLFEDRKVRHALPRPRSKCSDGHDTSEEIHHDQTCASESSLDFSIIEGGVDGLPALPLDGLQKPVFRKHFHQFFSREYEKTALLLVPPPMSTTEKAAAARKKYETLATALTVPAFCLNCVAAAHHQTVFRKDLICPNANTMIIHSKITLLLRDRLIDADQHELRDLIYIIFTLVMYEIANHRNCRAHALPVHRRALDHLVTRHGGVHNMGETIPYIYSLDRIISLFTDQPPSYAPKITRTIRRPCKDPYVYGAFFESPASNMIHKQVKEYGFDTCRAIDLNERMGWSFGSTGSSPHSPADLHYLYFLKDCVVNQYAHLNAGMAGVRDVSRCILLATKVVDYVVLQNTYFVTIPMYLADKLHDMISDTTDAAIPWNGQRDILIWILFVLTCMPAPWDKRPWALTLLRSQLSLKYLPEIWPLEWRKNELKNVKQFVWSDTQFNDGFRRTCNELAELSMALSRESTDEEFFLEKPQ